MQGLSGIGLFVSRYYIYHIYYELEFENHEFNYYFRIPIFFFH